ncbi:hypothetical protein V2G26_018894 [Clonostachys chloroleuca]
MSNGLAFLQDHAAVATKKADQDIVFHVRLYYVEADTYLVKEIRRSGPPSNDTWEFGKEFNSKGYDVDEKSGLSANVVRVGDQHQLKVYFQKHPDELSVAYRVLEAPHEDWSDRTDIAN